MDTPLKSVAAAFAAVGILHAAAAPLSPGDAARAPLEIRAPQKVQHIVATRGLARAGSVRASHARAFRLDAPPADLAGTLRPASKFAPVQVGVHRDVPMLATAADTSVALEWQRLADGSQVAAITVASPSAASVRAGVRIERLPASATVRFQAPGADSVYEFSGEEINSVVATNLEAGEDPEQSRVFWSPLVEGDSVVIELQLPAGVDARSVRISVPHVSHLLTSPAKDFALPTKSLSGSASCEVDACTAPTPRMNAVARMLFGDGTGNMFFCTGTLLADQDAGSQVPYFLSANHCISTQIAASSLTTYWFFRSAACLSPSPSQQLAGGATLLYQTANTDTSFMRLNNTPPQGAVFAGWAVGSTPPTGTSITGLHHPAGDYLKISNGTILGYLTCTPPTNGQFSCSMSTASASTFYDTRWTSGITEGGSSGSGLFRDSDGALIGQLYGGTESCTQAGDDIYGRFDVAYNSALSRWLAGQPLSVSRSGSGTGSVTSSPAGIDCGSTCSASFASGTNVTLTAAPAPGAVFTGWSGACTGSASSCVVDITAATTVVATFASAPGAATLGVSVSGSGSVTSSPAGIDCASSCSASFASGTSVTLSATPSAGMSFQGWSGACAGSGACTVTMNSSTTVSAAFRAKTAPAVTLASSANPSNAGQTVSFQATVAGAATGTMAFTSDGAFIPGCSTQPVTAGSASCATSSLAAGVHSIMATYSGDAGNAPNNSAPLTQTIAGSAAASGTLLGLSTRMQVLTGNDVLIGGFVIGGTAPKTVVVRARGPSLAAQGITGALADPALTVVPASGAAPMANDDWSSAANASTLSALGFAPGNAKESALLVTLDPGAYTAIVNGVGGTTGVALVEVYEIDHPEVPITGISTRGQVQTGGGVMIGGFVIEGSNPQTVVIRARGPSLASQGIAGTLQDPMLQLFSGSTLIGSNDDWGTAPNAAQISASGFAPGDSRESAMLVTLNPGAYTAIVTGAGGATGVGIVEVFGQ
ncbi:MAG TPA: Ig-like domain repeat protein [Usitatibacter sp.]|nr:Ig-like domain repeat protein [Usitatibacter sp.]